MNLFKKSNLLKNVKGESEKKLAVQAIVQGLLYVLPIEIYTPSVSMILLVTRFFPSPRIQRYMKRFFRMWKEQEFGLRICKVFKIRRVDSIVFDRSGRKYHGCVKAFAESMREGGLKF